MLHHAKLLRILLHLRPSRKKNNGKSCLSVTVLRGNNTRGGATCRENKEKLIKNVYKIHKTLINVHIIYKTYILRHSCQYYKCLNVQKSS